MRMPPDPDEQALIRAAQAGDLDAFAQLVRLHERRLYLVLLRLLGDERDAEEATQDAFVQAWRNLHRYRSEAAVFTWLYRIGVNEALQRRRRKRLDTVDLDYAESAASAAARSPAVRAAQPEAGAEQADLRARIAAALRSLPDDLREAVVLRDIAGLDNDEVAAALELSVPAAKSRIHRGRMQLRALLEPLETP